MPRPRSLKSVTAATSLFRGHLRGQRAERGDHGDHGDHGESGAGESALRARLFDKLFDMVEHRRLKDASPQASTSSSSSSDRDGRAGGAASNAFDAYCAAQPEGCAMVRQPVAFFSLSLGGGLLTRDIGRLAVCCRFFGARRRSSVLPGQRPGLSLCEALVRLTCGQWRCAPSAWPLPLTGGNEAETRTRRATPGLRS